MTTMTTAAGNTPGRPAPRPIVAGQLASLEALIVIGRTRAHLPAAAFAVSHIYPDRVAISFYDDLGDFEVWRAALGITAESVTYATQPGNTRLEATTTWGGTTIALTGYGPLPANGPEQPGEAS